MDYEREFFEKYRSLMGSRASQADLDRLAIASRDYAEYRTTQEKLEQAGVVYRAGNGDVAESPLLKIRDRAAERVSKYLVSISTKIATRKKES